ncbi:hypothetical protein GUJ93_ZPchr0013g36578 [Zizania palustris]|uniref:Uncharacterized protein n=1 Tax=Zizania palustris TaxID=103762 RepID=A0A8J5WX20_ZIZPA|nr:hypothetical protein GUJ93_ZPchr0013g36578 [Zizania palustris]
MPMRPAHAREVLLALPVTAPRASAASPRATTTVHRAYPHPSPSIQLHPQPVADCSSVPPLQTDASCLAAARNTPDEVSGLVVSYRIVWVAISGRRFCVL